MYWIRYWWEIVNKMHFVFERKRTPTPLHHFEHIRCYNSTATKSVPTNTIPPTASGMSGPMAAPAEPFVVEVEDDPAPELVPDPVCPAAGEEVVFAVVPFEVCAAPDVETPGGTVPPGQLVGGEAVLACATWMQRKLAKSFDLQQKAEM